MFLAKPQLQQNVKHRNSHKLDLTNNVCEDIARAFQQDSTEENMAAMAQLSDSLAV